MSHEKAPRFEFTGTLRTMSSAEVSSQPSVAAAKLLVVVEQNFGPVDATCRDVLRDKSGASQQRSDWVCGFQACERDFSSNL